MKIRFNERGVFVGREMLDYIEIESLNNLSVTLVSTLEYNGKRLEAKQNGVLRYEGRSIGLGFYFSPNGFWWEENLRFARAKFETT